MDTRQNLSDSTLINRYKSGDKSVLPVLVGRYHKTFCEKAYWLTKDTELAKDIAQESWLAIIDKFTSLEDVNSFKSWALRIVYTKSIDSIKYKMKESKNLKHIGTETNYEERHNVINKEKLRISLYKSINQLPKNKQDIIRLFYAEEYSVKEISSFLNIPLGTVKSRLFKAREKLKSIIKIEDYEK